MCRYVNLLVGIQQYPIVRFLVGIGSPFDSESTRDLTTSNQLFYLPKDSPAYPSHSSAVAFCNLLAVKKAEQLEAEELCDD